VHARQQACVAAKTKAQWAVYNTSNIHVTGIHINTEIQFDYTMSRISIPTLHLTDFILPIIPTV